jgi:hypothetical protein
MPTLAGPRHPAERDRGYPCENPRHEKRAVAARAERIDGNKTRPRLRGRDFGEKLVHLGVQALVGAGAHFFHLDLLEILG